MDGLNLKSKYNDDCIQFFIYSMEQSHKVVDREFTYKDRIKAKYSRTSMKKKCQLIDYVLNKKFTIYKASKKLKISNSTSKFIILNYLKYGTVLERNTKAELVKLLNDVKPQNPNQDHQIKLEQESAQPAIQPKIEEAERSREIENLRILSYSYPFYGFPYSCSFALPQL